MNRPTLWRGARVVTLDPTLPRAEALVTGGSGPEGQTILWVGPEAEARRAAGPGAQEVDLGGQTVVPGFNDNHLHLLIHGDQAEVPDLTGLHEGQIVETLRRHAPKVSPRLPLIAYGWDTPTCPRPHRRLLDEAFPGRRVILAQFGGHGLWVSSPVLADLGIDRHRGPAEGVALRDDLGDPTGILHELGSSSPMGRHFQAMVARRDLREPRIARALDEYRKVGITSVQDNSWYAPVVGSLARFRRRGGLTARVSCWSFGREPATLPAMGLAPYDDHWVHRGPRKYFLDGTFTTRTAWMTEAYPGFPGDYGLGFDPRWLEGVLERLARQGLQGAFHSIGDRSTQVFLDVWQKVVARHPGAVDLRMRLEHVQALRPEDLPRMRDLGVCAAAQPPALVDPAKDEALIGRDRALRSYPHRSLLDHGVPLSFGSDIPGEGFFDPLRGMALVTGRPGPEAITALEALRAYTQGSAYVEFEEHRKGTLRAGYLADFTVLTGDPTALSGPEITGLKVTRTVVGGRTVWG